MTDRLVVPVLAAALVVAGCGETDPKAAPRSVAETAHGLTVELPDGWQRARESLTPDLFDPREVLSVGTYPLTYRKGECAQMPSSAIDDLGSGDAFITLQERGTDDTSTWAGFPPRPEHFGPEADEYGGGVECVSNDRLTDYWFGFTDAGRHFHVLMAMGREVSDEVRAQAWKVLDSLRVDPDVKPDWTSSG